MYLSYTDTVVNHLARLNHRIAIIDWCIHSIEEDQIRFRIKNYADNNRQKGTSVASRGAYPPFSTAYYDRRSDAKSALRFSSQSLSHGQACSDPHRARTRGSANTQDRDQRRSYIRRLHLFCMPDRSIACHRIAGGATLKRGMTLNH